MRRLSFFLIFLPLAVISTLLCGLVYLAVQQEIRHQADDPQIQMAEDTANSLSKGETLQTSTQKLDISQSLSPFTITFNRDGSIVSSSAQLDGQDPVLPGGVFQAASRIGEDRFTWQPQTGVRIAAVLVHYSGTNSGYVLVGRSLREVEKRQDDLLTEVAIVWVLSL